MAAGTSTPQALTMISDMPLQWRRAAVVAVAINRVVA
jgi:hypothetical protein